MGIVKLESGHWFDSDMLEKERKFMANLHKRALNTDFVKSAERQFKFAERRKFALIEVGKTQKYAWIDPENMSVAFKGYYSPTEMKYKSFRFIRWGTSFDM